MLRKDLYQPVYIFFGAALYLYLLGIATFCGSLSLDTLSSLVTKVLPSGSDTRFWCCSFKHNTAVFLPHFNLLKKLYFFTSKIYATIFNIR